MFWKAAKTSAGLSVLFLVVYNSCNYLTSLRHDVGTFYWQWERHIPFIPIFIVPYMSIDLFFVAAPFLCRGEVELRTLRQRIVAAVLIAGACFLIVPLRFAFDRPHVDGILGVVFNNFRNFDKPFNQCPSLHMTLRTILAVFYVRRFRGVLKWCFRIWFSLIGFSTIFTYQHHVIDIIAGFALGIFCIHLFQDEPLRMPSVPNRRVGVYYVVGAVVLFAGAVALRGWGLLLLWPALSMALVATGYFGIGPGIYRKKSGRISITGLLLLWPIILAQRLSLVYYARQCEAWHALTPNVFIGRKLSNAEAERAVAAGVTAVVDLTCESSEASAFRAVQYRQTAVLDLTAPPLGQIHEAIRFIDQQSASGIVYIHCKAGYSRTAVIAAAHLLWSGRAKSVDEAIALLRVARPAIIIRPEAMEAIRMFDPAKMASMETAAAVPVRRGKTSPWKLVGLFALLPVFAGFIYYLYVVFGPSGPYYDMDSQEVFASHLLVLGEKDHLLNINSEDPRAVQSWFASRLDFMPPVRDLSAQGYILAGGRLDYMHGRPVAAIVYARDNHIVDVFCWPGENHLHGFERSRLYLVPWNDGGMTFWAISDLNGDELGRFSDLYKAAKP